MNRLLNDYDFDGIDLAWQFPPAKVKKERGTFGSIWHGIKKTFGYGKFKDDKEVEHRDGFTILVRDLKAQLRPRLKDLTIGVLPHVNSTGEYRFYFSFFFYSNNIKRFDRIDEIIHFSSLLRRKIVGAQYRCRPPVHFRSKDTGT